MPVFEGNPYYETITYLSHDECHPYWHEDRGYPPHGYPLNSHGERINWTPLFDTLEAAKRRGQQLRKCDNCRIGVEGKKYRY